MKHNAYISEHRLTDALSPRAEWRALAAAFLATLLALPVNAAVTVPGDPLASGVRVAPNILFILDDSGSMARDYMPDDVPGTSTPDVSLLAYTRNSLSYNPAIDYEPWVDADGNRLAGGATYDSAYSHASFVRYMGLTDTGTSKQLITDSGTIDLSTDTRTFYLPKDGVTDLGVGTNYYRYQILTDRTIYRSEYRNYSASQTPIPAAVSATLGTVGNTSSGNYSTTYSVTVPAGAYLQITTTGGSTSNRGADLYVRLNNSSVDASNYDWRSRSNGNSETLTLDEPAVGGTYYVRVHAGGSFNGSVSVQYSYRDVKGCTTSTSGSAWRACTPVTKIPGSASATIDDELVNYATWYSYFRTRNKAAKAGAAEAFSAPSLGNKVRVGYTSIWDSNPYYIPVRDGNDGRFVDNNGANGNAVTYSRSRWYSHLFAASGNSTTPLQGALNRAGQYFSNSYTGKIGREGPYGPETGTDMLSCRQNFAILTTDGYWNNSVVNTTSSKEGDGWNGATITNGPALADGGVPVLVNGLPNPDYKTYRYVAAKPYHDGYDNTLADVAMRYWKQDLMPTLANNVPSSYPDDAITDDPAFWQHMVTFGISIGLKTSKGLSSVNEVDASTTWPNPDTANPTRDNDARIDDLLHAAVNGRGTFVAATNPQQFADGLAAALAKVNERTAAFSNAGASDSTQLNSGTLIFTASYVSGRWTGLLRADNAVSGAGVWRTTDPSPAKFANYSTRKVFTRNGVLTNGVGAGGVGGGMTFPTPAQAAVLARGGGPANYAVTAANNADYIKGRQSLEGSSAGQLRVRSTIMGDVVNSSPAYVKDSDTVFVGANDGMLHAFNASTGVEHFAYVPNIINVGMLAGLSRGDYEHSWFVDGPIAISTKAVSPGGATNILVGALGRGGKGLYALDVTSPGTFAAGNALWETSSTNAVATSDNMGFVMGMPILGKVRNTTSSSAVILGNGINSGSDKAALLVLNMADGSVIKEIATDNTTNNGLSAPTGIYAADGKTIIYAYAGDMQGNVWKFDMTSSNPSAWTSKKIFHAEKAAGVQPITGGIASAVDPRTNKRWIFFGTGSFITAADGNDNAANKQSMYGVMDDISTGAAYERSNLTARTVTADASGDERYFQNLSSITNKGWYVDLPGLGERIVQNAQVDGSYLVTASMIPSGNSCADAAGSGYINAITPFPGMTASGKSYFDLDRDGNTDDTGTSGYPTGSVKTSGMPTLPLLLPGQLRYQTSSGSGGSTLFKGQPRWSRVSWRELRQD